MTAVPRPFTSQPRAQRGLSIACHEQDPSPCLALIQKNIPELQTAPMPAGKLSAAAFLRLLSHGGEAPAPVTLAGEHKPGQFLSSPLSLPKFSLSFRSFA